MITMRSLIQTVLGLALVVVVSCHVGRQNPIPPNRCLAGQSCFPSRSVLKDFEETLDGTVAYPSSPSYWLLVQRKNSRATRHPAMIVDATSVADIQKAMRFARKYQLMVTTASDNDDPTGRDNYDGSLNINIRNLKSVSVNDQQTKRSEFGEITAQAGALWEDVYTQARQTSKDVVAPDHIKSTVGSTVSDGGIGPLIRVYGLVSDNLLEAQVVMADGSLVTVSEEQVVQDFGDNLKTRSFDRALFAAISAGGVGPWGVVVSYTFKMHQSPAGIIRHTISYNLWKNGGYVGEGPLVQVLDLLDTMPDQWGGSYYISGEVNTDNAKGTLVVNLFYYGNDRSAAAYSYINSFTAITDAQLSSDEGAETSVLELQKRDQLSLNLFSFKRRYTFSTLLQKQNMVDENKKLAKALLFSLNNPTMQSTYYCSGSFLGGAVENGNGRKLDLVNPLVRSSYMALNCYLVYPDQGLNDNFYINHVFDFVQLLKPFGQGMDRYWASSDLPNWKQDLYGPSFGKLIETKLKYDIDNYLWCPNCVGSDYRIRGCNQPKKDLNNIVQYGNLLGGFISNERFAANEADEESKEHRGRLLFINQMTVGN